ncbi:NAD-dependent succinate-semialdehyde dehydrogenase [Kiloniella sp. b19]|uniref:NAD-dependent succinate-semialdehyde dehydrogenase n=1 Tax=Kiloniella sp. GXU_MW_B19 TaxID=3141326 RepID=UPI0031DF8655
MTLAVVHTLDNKTPETDQDQLEAIAQSDAWFAGWLKRAVPEQGRPVLDPSTQRLLACVPEQSVEDLAEIVKRAEAAQKEWRRMTAPDRSEILRTWQNLVVEHSEALARLVTLEQGKVLSEAQSEVRSAMRYIEWFCEEARRAYGRTIPAPRGHQQMMTIQQPIGVVAAITPWNFPAQLIARKCAPALAAGCAVVAKPAPETPLSAMALADLAHRAGVPEDVFAVVTGDPVTLGAALCEHETIRMVSFTGSTAVGKSLMERCARTAKKTTMELGGNAPFIVFADADLDKAVEHLMASKFRNSGQTCVCANRILVQKSVVPELEQRLLQAMEKLRIGPGLHDGVEIGPLIHQAAFDKVSGLVERALEQGARLLLGGQGDQELSLCYQPTLLSDVRPDMEIFETEIFGPVVALTAFETEDEALALANDTPYGLASYVFTQDMGCAFRMMEDLEYGLVGINNGVLSSAAAPFGGVKESGLGREGGSEGLSAFMETKYVNFDY